MKKVAFARCNWSLVTHILLLTKLFCPEHSVCDENKMNKVYATVALQMVHSCLI